MHQSIITNPILIGFHPDPSICRAENDYYLVTSSFAYYPGLPVFHSADLVKWEQIGYAFDRPEQINLTGFSVSRGLFAPAIRYHNQTFYITCTLVSGGENFEQGKNFLITARHPKGPWSDPVWLPEIIGIDPSLFFDSEPGDEKAYIVYNSLPPDNNPLHEGHRTIRMFEFDFRNLKVTGDEKLLVNGGIDISQKPIWVEGPHIFKKDGFYYLICAEGGTGYDHSEVVFRCKNVEGPYDPCGEKPILTQRTLETRRKNPITSTGHADFVETTNGNWYAVFLGCRPYEDDYYNTGRETFMAPVDWVNGWPVINPDHEEVQYSYSVSADKKSSPGKINGNFYFRDRFDRDALNMRYNFLRNVREQWYHIDPEKKSIAIKLRPETCSGNQNPSFIGFKQSHLKGYAQVSLLFETSLQNEKAGLLVFQNEDHFYFLCMSVENNQPVVQLYKGPGNENVMKAAELLVSAKIDTRVTTNLKIEAKGKTYSFYYAQNKSGWVMLKKKVDAKFLSTKVAGGFVGCMYAMYATSSGEPSQNIAYFNCFCYNGDDDIYKINNSLPDNLLLQLLFL